MPIEVGWCARLRPRLAGGGAESRGHADHAVNSRTPTTFRRLRLEPSQAPWAVYVRAGNACEIDHEVVRRVPRELDLEQAASSPTNRIRYTVYEICIPYTAADGRQDR